MGLAPMPARSPGLSFCGAFQREMWKLPLYLRPAFLCSLPHPSSNRNSPGGFWPSGSLLNGAIPGWGGACFHSLGAACCSKVCLPLTHGPGRLLRLASPIQPLAPNSLLGYVVRWLCPGQKSRTPCGFSELPVSRNCQTLVEWWETPGFEGGGGNWSSGLTLPGILLCTLSFDLSTASRHFVSPFYRCGNWFQHS